MFLLNAGNSELKAQNEFRQDDSEKFYTPDYLKLQVAGQIGYLSIGIGKSFMNEKLESDLNIGFVPKSIGGENISILTFKQSLKPFEIITQVRGIKLHPITTGIYLSYHFGDRYNKYNKDNYPSDYYWFMDGSRIGAYIGGDINICHIYNSSIKSFSIYYELGITDLDVYRFSKNYKQFDIQDIINIAFGIKTYLN